MHCHLTRHLLLVCMEITNPIKLNSTQPELSILSLRLVLWGVGGTALVLYLHLLQSPRRPCHPASLLSPPKHSKLSIFNIISCFQFVFTGCTGLMLAKLLHKLWIRNDMPYFSWFCWTRKGFICSSYLAFCS